MHPPLQKFRAFDPLVLAMVNAKTRREKKQIFIEPGADWLTQKPEDSLTLARVRQGTGTVTGMVTECDPRKDRLRLRPLPEGEDALQALIRARSGAVPCSSAAELQWRLSELIAEERLLSPLQPRRVFAAAANFPSHLRHDLAIPLDESRLQRLRRGRPRLFLKHPRVAASPSNATETVPEILGPFGTASFPERVAIPTSRPNTNVLRPPVIDHEVEIGAVIGTRLDRAMLATLSGDELSRAIAGYVLATNTKIRNPQIANRVRQGLMPTHWPDNTYRLHETALDGGLGLWDAETCRWWSEAAGCGVQTALGPFLVAAPPDGRFPTRAMLSARTYSGVERPLKNATGKFFLRQATRVAQEAEIPDAMVWPIPALLRSLLAPDGVCDHLSLEPELLPGDVVLLGTPGGCVITSKPLWLLCIVQSLQRGRGPEGWHDLLFSAAARRYYLLPGDEVFYWAEGLGFQRLRIA